MKIISKKLTIFLLGFAFVTMIFTSPLLAQESNTIQTDIQSKVDSWTIAGTVTRSPKTFHLGTMYVSGSGKLYFFIPNNNNRDLVQGTVNMLPITGGGGTSTSFNFANYATEYPTVSFDNLKAGTYMVIVDAYAVGLSQSGTIMYHK